MRKILALIFSFSLYACSSFAPIDSQSGTIRTRISDGTLFQPGDRVRVTTIDGTITKFRVVESTPEFVTGKDISIATVDIAEIEVRKFSLLKTTGFVGIAVFVNALGSAAAVNNALSSPGRL